MISKIAYIHQLSNGKWRVVSKSGKNLGTYNTKTLAKKRLAQVEMFKHVKNKNKNHRKAFLIFANELATKDESQTFSSVMRDLNKNDPENVKDFMMSFKNSFNNALMDKLENPDCLALMHSMTENNKNAGLKSYNIIKIAQSIVEMGNPLIAGRTIANMLKLLINKTPHSGHQAFVQNLKNRISGINIHDISIKAVPPTGALGQSIALIKNVLSGHNPDYIKQIIAYIVRYL